MLRTLRAPFPPTSQAVPLCDLWGFFCLPLGSLMFPRCQPPGCGSASSQDLPQRALDGRHSWVSALLLPCSLSPSPLSLSFLKVNFNSTSDIRIYCICKKFKALHVRQVSFDPSVRSQQETRLLKRREFEEHLFSKVLRCGHGEPQGMVQEPQDSSSDLLLSWEKFPEQSREGRDTAARLQGTQCAELPPAPSDPGSPLAKPSWGLGW